MSAPGGPQWFVIVDETMGGYLGRQITQVMPAGTQEQAYELAERVAFTHMPRHPSSPKSRAVFRTGPNSWHVQVTGRTATFHFVVTVGSWLGGVEH